MATFSVSPDSAKRTLELLAYVNGDLSRAAYECRLTLQSLGPYTDRKTENVLRVVVRLQQLTPERLAQWLTQLETIAHSTV